MGNIVLAMDLILYAIIALLLGILPNVPGFLITIKANFSRRISRMDLSICIIMPGLLVFCIAGFFIYVIRCDSITKITSCLINTIIQQNYILCRC